MFAAMDLLEPVAVVLIRIAQVWETRDSCGEHPAPLDTLFDKHPIDDMASVFLLVSSL